VKAFDLTKIRKEVLLDLIKNSEIVELDGDGNPMSLLETKNQP